MRLLPRAVLSAFVSLAVPAALAAQTREAASVPPPVGSTLSADVVRDLPLGDSVYAVLENTQAEVISDRFNSGGLNIGGDTRVGGFLGSWSQTLFRVGDLDVSDPNGSGAPLLSPDTAFWQRVTVHTGLMPADMNTPGLGVTLDPMRGGTTWSGIIGGSGSGGSLAPPVPTSATPPIARLIDYAHGSGVVAGPLSARATLAAGASFANGESYLRERRAGPRSSSTSGFANLVFSQSAERDIKALGWFQRTDAPAAFWQTYTAPASAAAKTAVHLQATLDQHPANGAQWRVFAGFTQRARTFDLPSTSMVVSRITDGPVPQAVDDGADTTSRRIEAGARLVPWPHSSSAHHVEFGVNGAGASTATTGLFAGTVRELVDTTPARIWTYTAPAVASHRQTATASGFAADHIVLSPRLTLDAGLRLELVTGRADGSATPVSWVDALPHAAVRYAFSDTRSLTLSYARSGNQLTHNWLAYGDPGASTATVAAAAAPNVIVSRVGPGTGGNAAFSRVDPNLKRPVTDEFVVGWEKRRSAQTRYTLTGIIRRETRMLGIVDTGAPTSSYATLGFPDAGKDLINPSDDRTLVVYNRTPVTFGQDAYLLTNPDQQAARAFALRMSLEHATDRLFLLFGASASAAQGSVSNRGYGPLENDQDQPGEVFTNPNAASYAYGRLFSDRAFTIKWTTLYRFPGDITIAGIARYQDGQPFSRLVVVPTLNQGAEAVQTYPNAGSRYTFTGTLDLQARKGISIGRSRVDILVDAYNLFTRGNEVEEYVVSGTAFRTPTFIEPPRSIHLGLRVAF